MKMKRNDRRKIMKWKKCSWNMWNNGQWKIYEEDEDEEEEKINEQ